jgi:hypothetical protein
MDMVVPYQMAEKTKGLVFAASKDKERACRLPVCCLTPGCRDPYTRLTVIVCLQYGK